MAGRIPSDFIDDLLVRVDIVDLIDSHVPLKKSGSNYVARCPFHTEKTPSFSVNRQKQFYHCFGCGAGGNAISFLMAFDHLEFVEAVEELADFVGVDVPREAYDHQPSRALSKSLYVLLEQIAIYYAEQLRINPEAAKAVQYLKSRQLTGEVAKKFALGYAPRDAQGLVMKFDRQLMIDAGVLGSNNSGGVFDRFRGRLIFPIRDKRSRVIGFGGRVLDDSMPKYLNSPETTVFSKSKELYGLCELLEKNSKPERIVMVEGYMDVIALAQFGFENCVAALGTAASLSHFELLFRFTTEIVLCFDGDSAGKKATWKAIKEGLPSLRDGRMVRVLSLHQDQDPDSYVREEGGAAFEYEIQNAQSLSDYFFKSVCDEVDMDSTEGKSRFLATAKPLIEKIPKGFFQDLMLDRMRRLSGAPTFPQKQDNSAFRPRLKSGRERFQRSKPSPMRTAIALLLQNPHLSEIFIEKELDLSSLSLPGVELLQEIMQIITSIKPVNSAVLIEHFRGKENEKIVLELSNWQVFILDHGVEAEFAGALDRMVAIVKEKELTRLLEKERQQGLSQEEKLELCKLLPSKH